MTLPLTSEERFEFAVGKLLEHEGGFTDLPADPGGATNFGITQRELSRVYQKLHLPADVRSLTLDDAKKYYRIEWWEPFHYDAINSIAVGAKIFDMAVNMGAHQAHELVQRALNDLGYRLKVDGLLGGKTLGAINDCINRRMDDDLMADIINEQKWFYEHIVEDDLKLHVFLNGWLHRAAYQGT